MLLQAVLCRGPSSFQSFSRWVESYYDLSSCMSCFQTPESLRSLAQRVGSVDDRGYLSCLHEIAQDGQVLIPQSRNKYDEALRRRQDSRTTSNGAPTT